MAVDNKWDLLKLVSLRKGFHAIVSKIMSMVTGKDVNSLMYAIRLKSVPRQSRRFTGPLRDMGMMD
jgi:hypothetical protein